MTGAQRLAEWDWVESWTGSLLHHADLTAAQAEEMDDHGFLGEPVAATCGRRLGGVRVPSLGARLAAARCRRCCDRLAYPHGAGSPKNDDRCRPLVKARIAKGLL